jgi:homoserine O-acetyltransferase
MRRGFGWAAAALMLLAGAPLAAQAPAPPAMAVQPVEGDFVVRNFRFRSGETLPELRLHYTTIGKPQRDAKGQITNAVMVLHGTGGSGGQFLRPQFRDVLLTPGGLLDPARYYIILPDNIGHGKSSKPSDGLRARFPRYDYDDMVAAQHALLTRGLGVQKLRLLAGTSMGCMHAFVWGQTHPDFSQALLPLACLPVEIAGRNRAWRKMAMDAIRADPAWRGGDYTAQPLQGLRTAENLLILAGAAPLPLQASAPTREAADKWLEERFNADIGRLDANDLLYQIDSSRNYNPAPGLERITAPLTLVNSADDFITRRSWGSPSARWRGSGTAATCCCPPRWRPRATAPTPGPPCGRTSCRPCWSGRRGRPRAPRLRTARRPSGLSWSATAASRAWSPCRGCSTGCCAQARRRGGARCAATT